MKHPVFMVKDIKWWNKPIPLYRRENGGLYKIGWVWRQRALLVKNISLGWIALVDDQTEDNLDVWSCDHCGASLWASKRNKIIEHIKNEQN